MSDRDIERRHHRAAATTERSKQAYDWGDPVSRAPRQQQAPPGARPQQRALPPAPPARPGRREHRHLSKRRSIPVVFLVLALAGVFTFVAVGLALGGALFSGGGQEGVGAAGRAGI